MPKRYPWHSGILAFWRIKRVRKRGIAFYFRHESTNPFYLLFVNSWLWIDSAENLAKALLSDKSWIRCLKAPAIENSKDKFSIASSFRWRISNPYYDQGFSPIPDCQGQFDQRVALGDRAVWRHTSSGAKNLETLPGGRIYFSPRIHESLLNIREFVASIKVSL